MRPRAPGAAGRGCHSDDICGYIFSTFYEINIGLYYEYTEFIAACQGVNTQNDGKFLENVRPSAAHRSFSL